MLTMEKFLQLQSDYFRLLGYDLFAAGTTANAWRHPYRTIYSIMSVLSFLPLTMAFCMRYAQNVDKLTDGLCSVLIDLLALFKYALILYRNKDIMQLIEQFGSTLSRESLASCTCAQIISRQNQREQLISRVYRNCFTLAATLALLLPILRRLLGQLEAQEQPELPFPSVYPWHNGHTFNYLLAYLWNICAAVGVLLPTVCVDTLFCSLTHNLCALLRIAQYRVLHFVGATRRETQTNLEHILNLYGQCLAMSGCLARIFRPLITIQFLLASLHLCVLCYQISANLMQPEVLFYTAFTCSILAQLYLYCYCAELVSTESSAFAVAIYDSDWFLISGSSSWSSVGLPLLLSMMRAQRGNQIDGLFFVANMQTFLSIVRRSMSYVTLLRSIS